MTGRQDKLFDDAYIISAAQSKEDIVRAVLPVCCSLANADGGRIIVENLPPILSSISEIQDAVRRSFSDKNRISACTVSDMYTFSERGEDFLLIDVAPAKWLDRPVFLNSNPALGTYRYFEGELFVSGKRLLSLMARDSVNTQMDGERLSDVEFDAESVRKYRELLRERRPFPKWDLLGERDFLERIGALADGEATLAGAVMFGSARSFFAFRSENHTISSNGILNFVDMALPAILSFSDRSPECDTALREAFFNCLIHADYSAGGIEIEADGGRVVFKNSGIPRAKNKNLCICRNPRVMKMMRLVGFASGRGRGISAVSAFRSEAYLSVNLDSWQTELALQITEEPVIAEEFSEPQPEPHFYPVVQLAEQNGIRPAPIYTEEAAEPVLAEVDEQAEIPEPVLSENAEDTDERALPEPEPEEVYTDEITDNSEPWKKSAPITSSFYEPEKELGIAEPEPYIEEAAEPVLAEVDEQAEIPEPVLSENAEDTDERALPEPEPEEVYTDEITDNAEPWKKSAPITSSFYEPEKELYIAEPEPYTEEAAEPVLAEVDEQAEIPESVLSENAEDTDERALPEPEPEEVYTDEITDNSEPWKKSAPIISSFYEPEKELGIAEPEPYTEEAAEPVLAEVDEQAEIPEPVLIENSEDTDERALPEPEPEEVYTDEITDNSEPWKKSAPITSSFYEPEKELYIAEPEPYTEEAAEPVAAEVDEQAEIPEPVLSENAEDTDERALPEPEPEEVYTDEITDNSEPWKKSVPITSSFYEPEKELGIAEPEPEEEKEELFDEAPKEIDAPHVFISIPDDEYPEENDAADEFEPGAESEPQPAVEDEDVSVVIETEEWSGAFDEPVSSEREEAESAEEETSEEPEEVQHAGSDIAEDVKEENAEESVPEPQNPALEQLISAPEPETVETEQEPDEEDAIADYRIRPVSGYELPRTEQAEAPEWEGPPARPDFDEPEPEPEKIAVTELPEVKHRDFGNKSLRVFMGALVEDDEPEKLMPQSLPNEDEYFDPEALPMIVQMVRNNPRTPAVVVREALLDFCRGTFRPLRDISRALLRSESSLKRRYIKPLLAEKALEVNERNEYHSVSE